MPHQTLVTFAFRGKKPSKTYYWWPTVKSWAVSISPRAATMANSEDCSITTEDLILTHLHGLGWVFKNTQSVYNLGLQIVECWLLALSFRIGLTSSKESLLCNVKSHSLRLLGTDQTAIWLTAAWGLRSGLHIYCLFSRLIDYTHTNNLAFNLGSKTHGRLRSHVWAKQRSRLPASYSPQTDPAN